MNKRRAQNENVRDRKIMGRYGGPGPLGPSPISATDSYIKKTMFTVKRLKVAELRKTNEIIGQFQRLHVPQ